MTEASPLGVRTLQELLDDVAAPVPDPGGGAASAVVLAVGVALAQMVAGYSPASDGAGPDPTERLHGLRADVLDLATVDGDASAGFASAIAVVGPGRDAAIAAAVRAAIVSALSIAEAAGRLLAELTALEAHAPTKVHADLQVAAALAAAVVRASAVNVGACLEMVVPTPAGDAGDAGLTDRIAGLDALRERADAMVGRGTAPGQRMDPLVGPA